MKSRAHILFVVNTTIIIFICLLLCGVASQAQDTNPAKSATTTILVTDMDHNVRQNEKIIFEDIVTGEIYEGISNEEGKFDITLPGAAEYSIKIKNIGDAEDYNKLSIPALKEGEMYGPMQLTIQFEPARAFTLDNVHFFSGKSTLTKASFPELNELVEFMNLKKGTVIEIAGHTDDVGEASPNLELSQARADAVKTYLVSKGVDNNRIVAKGYGEDFPVDSNETEEGRSKNRRTEIKIIRQ